MPEKISLNYQFLEPLRQVLARCTSTRVCPKHSDEDFLIAGLVRCISPVVSGREFLQLEFNSGEDSWKLSTFFKTLKSSRRSELAYEACALLSVAVRRNYPSQQWPDDLPEFDDFHIFAGDGHFHKGAVHDNKGSKGKIPVGQFFARDMRSAVLHYIDTAVPGEYKKGEHDMAMLKRQHANILRLGVEKGRKVLYVWDRAGIDFRQWFNWKQSAGIYFLTRAKEGMLTDRCGEYEWDPTDPRNNGVVSDVMIATSTGVAVRRVEYIDAVSGKEFAFITNLPASIPPGIIAWLYQRRWDVEKTFDETRNRLFEGKAWASSIEAKRIQGAFISMAYNLLLLLESQMKEAGEFPPEPREEARRAKRREQEVEKVIEAGRKLNYQLQKPPRRSQIGCKFIRWVRRHLTLGTSYAEAAANLGRLYKEFS